MDDKKGARANRLLAQMDGRVCSVTQSNDRSIIIVQIEGLRAVKCDLATVQQWMCDGVVTLRDNALNVTAAGRAAIKRNAAKRQPYRAQHDAINLKHTGATEPQRAQSNDYYITDESPLARLGKLKAADGAPYLSPLECEAGEKLRRDFEAGMMQPRVTASLDPARVAGSRSRTRNHAADVGDCAIAARERVAKALARLEPELAGTAIDICCFLKGLEVVETERGWPRRSAKLMLKTALGGLARHYFPVAKASHRRTGVIHWGADGYRPAIR